MNELLGYCRNSDKQKLFSDYMNLFVQNSPNNMSNMSNNLGTPRDDDTGGSYLHSFQNENVSLIHLTLSDYTLNL